MPMPTPNDGEEHDAFMGRCISDDVMTQEYEDTAQRAAVCQTQWEQHHGDKMSYAGIEKHAGDDKTAHDRLLVAVAGRLSKGGRFGYGITTADRYVRPALKASNAQGDQELLLTRAASTLVYSAPDMACEKAIRDIAEFPDIVPKGLSLPPNTLMVIKHTLTSSREDRDMDVLHTKGAVLDPKAPLLWQHLPTLPVGRVLSVVEHNDTMLKVVSVLLDMNSLTSDIAKLIEADVLRFSHGFRALEFAERKSPSQGQDPAEFIGFDVTRFEILEASLVSVPSNVDAEIELFCRGKLESDYYRAEAKELADKRPKHVQGASLPSAEKTAASDAKCGYVGIDYDRKPAKETLELCETACQECAAICRQTASDTTLDAMAKCESICRSCAALCSSSNMGCCRVCTEACNQCAIICASHYVEACQQACLACAAVCEACAEMCGAKAGQTKTAGDASGTPDDGEELNHKTAVAFRRTPISDAAKWEADAAMGRLRKWAVVDEDEPSDAAWKKYRQGFARAVGDGNKFGDFSFPHHDIEDGGLVVNKTAVAAGVAICNGARGANVAWESEDEREAVYQHLAKHYRDWDAEAPELKTFDAMTDEERTDCYGHAFAVSEFHGPHSVRHMIGATIQDAVAQLPVTDVVILADWFGEKVGRVMSRRNMDMLEMELPRHAQALVERCLSRMKDMMDSAASAEPEDSEERSIESAMRTMLGSADKSQLERLVASANAILEVYAADEQVTELRGLRVTEEGA